MSNPYWPTATKYDFIIVLDFIIFDFRSSRSILSSTKFFDANSRELKLTSMYVFLKPKYKPSYDDFATSEHFEWRDRFELPANCRITVLNIENTNQSTDENCCKNLNVFNDALEIGERILTEVNAAPPTAIENEMHTINGFYECKISIKGFKDQLIKGKSIWTQWMSRNVVYKFVNIALITGTKRTSETWMAWMLFNRLIFNIYIYIYMCRVNLFIFYGAKKFIEFFRLKHISLCGIFYTMNVNG